MLTRATLFLALSASLAAHACDSAAEGDLTTSDQGPDLAIVIPADGVLDFVATELNFHYPEGIGEDTEESINICGLDAQTDNTIYTPLLFDEVEVSSYDLDGVDTTDDSGPCGDLDYPDGNGGTGVDYAFLHAIDMIRPLRPDQLARGVLAEAPSEGLINFGIRFTGIDDLHNDDDVEVMLITTTEPPVVGTDGKIIPFASVTVDPNPEWRTVFKGRIDEGVLTTDPADFVLGDIDLLVIQDRVLRLEGARIHATIAHHDDGRLEFDARLAGWWDKENMIDVIGQGVLAIGSNEGELACTFDTWADYSSDGVECDRMSVIFEARGVSGFLTGFDGAGSP